MVGLARNFRNALSFAFQLRRAARGFAVDFQTRGAVFYLSRELVTAFFKFLYRLGELSF